MAATGLEVFDKTLQLTNTWLEELSAELNCGRQGAWHALSAVLHALRDRLQPELAAHLGAQLPLLVRGLYYDQWRPSGQGKSRHLDEFLAVVAQGLVPTQPADSEDAARAVFRTLTRHVDAGQLDKVIHALPEEVRSFWLTALERG